MLNVAKLKSNVSEEECIFIIGKCSSKFKEELFSPRKNPHCCKMCIEKPENSTSYTSLNILNSIRETFDFHSLHAVSKSLKLDSAKFNLKSPKARHTPER